MSLKSRLLRILLVLLFVGVFVGYFAFQTFLFPPLEGDYDKDVASLIPRDVDFYVSRSDVGKLFDGFPDLAVQEELDENDAWDTWVTSPEYEEFARESKLQETLQAVRDLQGRIPLGMDLPTIFGGEDVAVVGWYNDQDMARSDWAIYGRGNWMGKLAVSALKYPGPLGLEKQGVTATREEERIELSGGQLPRKLYLVRIRDVLICATKPEAIDAALDLEVRGGKDSFFQSALYFDQIYNHPARAPKKDDVELFVDLREYYEATKTSARWPDPKSQDMTPRLLARYFQANSVKQVTGILDVDDGMSLDLHGEFSSELITPLQNRFYRGRGFDRTQVQQVARFAPSDSAMFVYLQGNVGDLLTQVVESLDKDTRELIDGAFAETSQYSGLAAVIDDLGTSLKNRLALIVRANDYPPDASGPPHDDTPVPAVALIAWMEDEGKVVNVRDAVGLNSATFGLQGRNPGEGGYFAHTESGFATREFWSQLIPGTGVVATMNANEAFVVTNAYQMLGHLAKTNFAGESPALADRGDFLALTQSSLAKANLLVWIDPQSLSGVLRKQATRWAEDNIPEPDWGAERQRLEREVTAELFPGTARGALSADQEATMESEVDTRINSLSRQRFQEYFPRLMAKSERQLSYLEASTAMLLMLSFTPKHFDLSLRIVAPLEN